MSSHNTFKVIDSILVKNKIEQSSTLYENIVASYENLMTCDIYPDAMEINRINSSIENLNSLFFELERFKSTDIDIRVLNDLNLLDNLTVNDFKGLSQSGCQELAIESFGSAIRDGLIRLFQYIIKKFSELIDFIKKWFISAWKGEHLKKSANDLNDKIRTAPKEKLLLVRVENVMNLTEGSLRCNLYGELITAIFHTLESNKYLIDVDNYTLDLDTLRIPMAAAIAVADPNGRLGVTLDVFDKKVVFSAPPMKEDSVITCAASDDNNHQALLLLISNLEKTMAIFIKSLEPIKQSHAEVEDKIRKIRKADPNGVSQAMVDRAQIYFNFLLVAEKICKLCAMDYNKIRATFGKLQSEIDKQLKE